MPTEPTVTTSNARDAKLSFLPSVAPALSLSLVLGVLALLLLVLSLIFLTLHSSSSFSRERHSLPTTN